MTSYTDFPAIYSFLATCSLSLPAVPGVPVPKHFRDSKAEIRPLLGFRHCWLRVSFHRSTGSVVSHLLASQVSSVAVRLRACVPAL